MVVKRQKNQIQMKLTIFEEYKGEALNSPKWVETTMAKHKTESPVGKNIEIKSIKLMEEMDSCVTTPNRRVRFRMHGGVRGKACEGSPISIRIPFI